MYRRDFLWMSLSALTVGGGSACAGEPKAGAATGPDLGVSDEKWREVLDKNEYYILRDKGTERAFTGDLWDHKGDGIYVCAGCGLPLFDSKTKYESGTGWPSFYAPIAKDAVAGITDMTLGMIRTESVCGRCGGHLGHVFPDGPRPTGQRYCMNSGSLDFVPRGQAKALKGKPLMLGGWTADGGAK
jgi:peptide-methionine (R)-S-oxide reductase